MFDEREKRLVLLGTRINGKVKIHKMPIPELAKKYPGTFEDLKRAGLKNVSPGERLEVSTSDHRGTKCAT